MGKEEKKQALHFSCGLETKPIKIVIYILKGCELTAGFSCLLSSAVFPWNWELSALNGSYTTVERRSFTRCGLHRPAADSDCPTNTRLWGRLSFHEKQPKGKTNVSFLLETKNLIQICSCSKREESSQEI